MIELSIVIGFGIGVGCFAIGNVIANVMVGYWIWPDRSTKQ